MADNWGIQSAGLIYVITLAEVVGRVFLTGKSTYTIVYIYLHLYSLKMGQRLKIYATAKHYLKSLDGIDIAATQTMSQLKALVILKSY